MTRHRNHETPNSALMTELPKATVDPPAKLRAACAPRAVPIRYARFDLRDGQWARIGDGTLFIAPAQIPGTCAILTIGGAHANLDAKARDALIAALAKMEETA